MAKQIILSESREETASGHRESTKSEVLELRDGSIVLIDESRYTDEHNYQNNSHSIVEYSVSTEELCKWMKANGKATRKK